VQRIMHKVSGSSPYETEPFHHQVRRVCKKNLSASPCLPPLPLSDLGVATPCSLSERSERAREQRFIICSQDFVTHSKRRRARKYQIKKSLGIDYPCSKTTGYSANFIFALRLKTPGFHYFPLPRPSPIKERGIRKPCGKTTGNLKLIRRNPAVVFTTTGIALTKAEGVLLLDILELRIQDIDDLPKRS
jgi:hypothetical protein